MQDFDGLQPFLFAHITAIRPFLFLVTARIRAVYVPFYVFRESHDYAVPAKTTYDANRQGMIECNSLRLVLIRAPI